jgi:vitamin B12 transporter
MRLKAALAAAAVAAALSQLAPPAAYAQTAGGSGSRLDEIVVTATRAAEKLRDLPISPIIIGEEEIARHPNGDLSDILERAGVMVDRQYYLGGQVVLRGLQGNISGSDVQSDVLMLLNGHRIGTGSLLRFPAKNIMRVEVIRGPAALQYGSAAMGGVVNVITRRGDGPLRGYAEAGIGSWDHHDYAAGFYGEYGGFDFSAGGAEMGRHQDYETGDGQTYLGTTTGSRSEANAQIGYSFGESVRHRISAIGTFIDLDSYGFTGSIHDQNRTSGMSGVVNNTIRSSGTGRFLDLAYEGETETGGFDWEARYFYGEDRQGGNASPLAAYKNSMDGAQGRATGRFPEIGAEFTLGFDLTRYDFETTSAIISRYRYSDLGTYFLFKKTLLDDRLAITGGVRISRVETETPSQGGHAFAETKAIPALGASFMALDWLKLRANYARGYRAGSVNEMYGSGRAMVGRNYVTVPMMGQMNNVWQVPNPDLEPQESDSFEIGVDVEREAFSGSLTLFYSLFHGKIERLETPYPTFGGRDDHAADWPWVMEYNPTMPPPLAGFWNAMRAQHVGFPQRPSSPGGMPVPYAAEGKYVNFGDARQIGLEWNVRWDIGKELGLPLSLTPYSAGTWLPVSEYKSGPDEGLRMRKVPKWFTSYGLQVESGDGGLWLDVNFLTKSSQRTTSMTSDPNVPEVQPGWTIMNIRASKTLLESADRGTVTLVAQVSNVTDVYYESYPTYPLPGRGFYVGLRYDFR